MKKILFILIFIMSNLTLFAQLPDWVISKPVSHNYTMDYEVGVGEGDTYKQAQNEAYIDVMKKVITRCGLAVSTNDIMQAVYEGKAMKTINKDFRLPPIREVCSTSRRMSYNGKIRVYLLYQVPRDGSIISPQYENFSDCNSYGRTLHRSNTRAIVASTFIPGVGQMLKGQGGAGAAFLLSEVALFGGGTVCYFLGQNQAKIMKSTGTTYEQYVTAKNQKNILDIAMYACFGVGAAVHIGNMINAWYAKDLHMSSNWAFVPAVIPTNEFSNPSYAYGAGVQIKF